MPTPTPSIAVMPFVDMSPDQDQAFLGDGMAEEVINLLARESELKVSSRSSSFSFKKQEVDLATIANQLGVDHILEGSVREYDDKIKISVIPEPISPLSMELLAFYMEILGGRLL